MWIQDFYSRNSFSEINGVPVRAFNGEGNWKLLDVIWWWFLKSLNSYGMKNW